MKDQTYMNEKRIMKQDLKKVGKIGPVKTYFALLKGYCAIVILIIPKAFQNGGWLFSALALLFSCFLTTICTLKLVEAGLVTRFLNYSRITKTALGENAKRVLDIMLMLT
jgi:proton-coupled amino acid transporter